MPVASLDRDHPDRVLRVSEIAAAVEHAVRRLPEKAPVRENEQDEMSVQTSFAWLDQETIGRDVRPGVHAYTPEGVLDDEAEEVDRALWAAFRALRERADLASRTARRSHGSVAERLQSNAREALDQAELIRTILLERDASGG